MSVAVVGYIIGVSACPLAGVSLSPRASPSPLLSAGPLFSGSNRRWSYDTQSNRHALPLPRCIVRQHKWNERIAGACLCDMLKTPQLLPPCLLFLLSINLFSTFFDHFCFPISRTASPLEVLSSLLSIPFRRKPPTTFDSRSFTFDDRTYPKILCAR